MMKVVGRISVEQVLLVDQVLRELAGTLTASGTAQDRTGAQLRTDEFRSLPTGTRPTLPRVEIGLLMSERTLFRSSREPAHLTGCGTVPAGWSTATAMRYHFTAPPPLGPDPSTHIPPSRPLRGSLWNLGWPSCCLGGTRECRPRFHLEPGPA